MFGGPWLGVIAFVVVAIFLGWGLITLLNMQLNQARHTLSQTELDHGFDPKIVYTLKRDLLLGYTADGRKTLLPGKDDLPKNAPGRHTAATIADFRGHPGKYPDLIGVVERNTRVRFVEVIDDRNNPQTRVLVRVQLLDGRFAQSKPVLGMHLESADTDQDTGQKRYLPRPDLFEPARPVQGPVQSPAQEQTTPAP